MNTTRLFNPLTGEDLKKILLQEYSTKLDNLSTLQPHLTFPLVTYKLELTIESYPVDFPQIVRLEKTIGDESKREGEPVIEKVVYSRTLGETQDTAPDKVREEHNIPVLQPQKDPDTGRMVDKVQPRRAKSITVGKGTQPRATATPQVEVPNETGDMLDDSGNPVKVNSF